MISQYSKNPVKDAYAKTKSFLRGNLEGIVFSFIMPTYKRMENNYEIYFGENRENGRLAGFLANIFAHGYLMASLSEDKALYSLIPFTALNFSSGIYEYTKRRIKNI